MEETNYIHLRDPDGLTIRRRRIGTIGLCLIGLSIIEGMMINDLMTTTNVDFSVRNLSMVHFTSTYTMGLFVCWLFIEIGYHVIDERNPPILFDWMCRHRLTLLVGWTTTEVCMMLMMMIIPLSTLYRGIMMAIIVTKIGLFYKLNGQLID